MCSASQNNPATAVIIPKMIVKFAGAPLSDV